MFLFSQGRTKQEPKVSGRVLGVLSKQGRALHSLSPLVAQAFAWSFCPGGGGEQGHLRTEPRDLGRAGSWGKHHCHLAREKCHPDGQPQPSRSHCLGSLVPSSQGIQEGPAWHVPSVDSGHPVYTGLRLGTGSLSRAPAAAHPPRAPALVSCRVRDRSWVYGRKPAEG